MAIALFVSDGFGGYGDFLFGLKTISELKNRLYEKGYTGTVYLVTQDSGKKKLQDLKSDQEFDVTICSIEEFTELTKNPSFSLDYFIEGPVFSRRLLDYKTLGVREDTPVLFLPEYSMKDPKDSKITINNAYYKEQLLHNPLRWRSRIIKSGFNIFANQNAEKGILVSQELQQVAQLKRHQDFSFRETYWQEMGTLGHLIRSNQSIEAYHANTDLGFEYSWHNECMLPLYLGLYTVFTKHSEKNQGIVSVGGDKAKKKEAFNRILKHTSYRCGVYVDLDSGEVVVYQNDETHRSNPKTLYLFSAAKLSHRQMIAMQALSGDLVGITGDQSLGEALSAEKLILYENTSHKSQLVDQLRSLFRTAPNPNVRILFKAMTQVYKLDLLPKLLNDPEVLNQYQTICRNFIKNHNLIEAISQEILPVLKCTPISQENVDLQLLHALYQNDQVRIHDIMQACQANNLKPGANEPIALLRACFRNETLGDEVLEFTFRQSPSVPTLPDDTLDSSKSDIIATYSHPTKLSPEILAAYQIAFQNLSSQENNKLPPTFMKLYRGQLLTNAQQAPYSALKYPNLPGFYLLDYGEGAIIGQGAYGKVKQAYYCNQTGKIDSYPVVIKIEEKKEYAAASTEVALFSKVYPFAERHLYNHYSFYNKHYTVLPKFPGISLEHYLHSNPTLSFEKRLRIIELILVELSVLHEKEIAHLDLKAKNILYHEEGQRVYLIDFGWATPFKQKFETKDIADHLPPEYHLDLIANEKLDIYSCALLFGQILNIPYSSLISEKFKVAFSEISEESTKADMQTWFNQIKDGETLYYIPLENPLKTKFLVKFLTTSALDFNALKAIDLPTEIIKQIGLILSSMTQENPKHRPSAQTLYRQLIEIQALLAPTETLVLSAKL